jgi:hypothetical protein
VLRFHFHPEADARDQVSTGAALGLSALTTAGIGIFFLIFAITDAEMSVFRPLLLPCVLTFALCLSVRSGASARPLRILLCYVIVGGISLVAAAIDGSIGGLMHVDALIASAISIFVMYRFGLWHTPALAICLVASLAGFSWQDSLLAYPILLGLCIVGLILVVLARKLFFDPHYPENWF